MDLEVTNIVSLDERRKQKNAQVTQRAKSLDERCVELEANVEMLVSLNVDLSREVDHLNYLMRKILKGLKKWKEASMKPNQEREQKQGASVGTQEPGQAPPVADQKD